MKVLVGRTQPRDEDLEDLLEDDPPEEMPVGPAARAALRRLMEKAKEPGEQHAVARESVPPPAAREPTPPPAAMRFPAPAAVDVAALDWSKPEGAPAAGTLPAGSALHFKRPAEAAPLSPPKASDSAVAGVTRPKVAVVQAPSLPAVSVAAAKPAVPAPSAPSVEVLAVAMPQAAPEPAPERATPPPTGPKVVEAAERPREIAAPLPLAGFGQEAPDRPRPRLALVAGAAALAFVVVVLAAWLLSGTAEETGDASAAPSVARQPAPRLGPLPRAQPAAAAEPPPTVAGEVVPEPATDAPATARAVRAARTALPELATPRAPEPRPAATAAPRTASKAPPRAQKSRDTVDPFAQPSGRGREDTVDPFAQ